MPSCGADDNTASLRLNLYLRPPQALACDVA